MRDALTIKGLYREFRERLWDDYGIDVEDWNPAWRDLIRETLRTATGRRQIVLLKAEHDAVICVGLVAAATGPALFRANQVALWTETARESGRHCATLDVVSASLLIRLGYATLREVSEN